jgi:hypothetical protein
LYPNPDAKIISDVIACSTAIINSTSVPAFFFFFKQQAYGVRGCATLTPETSSLLNERTKSITQVASPLDISIASFAFSHNLFPEYP